MKIIALLESKYEEAGKIPFIPTLAYPDSVMVRSGNPIFLPEFDSSFRAIFYLGVKISRLGKSIAERFASRYYSQVAPVMVAFPSELVNELGSRGLPWTGAACFDRSVIVGDFRDYSDLCERGNFRIAFSHLPEECAALPSEKEIGMAIQEVSRNNALKMGDLILVPLQCKSLTLHPDTFLNVCSGDEVLLKTAIK